MAKFDLDNLSCDLRFSAAPFPGPPPIISIIPNIFYLFNKNLTFFYKTFATKTPSFVKALLRRAGEGTKKFGHGFTQIYTVSASLVFLANPTPKASSVIEFCLRPPRFVVQLRRAGKS